MALTKPTNTQLAASVTAFSSTTGDDALLLGTDGNDIISGGTTTIESTASDGKDLMEGGLGDDVYIVRDTTDVVSELANEGNDTVWTSVSYSLNTALAAEVENIGATTSTGPTTLTGNAKDNILDGSQSTAVNTLVGLTGNDSYYFDANDVVTEAAGGGTDTVFADFSVDLSVASVNFTLASAGAIDNVILTAAAGAANAKGNALNNHLTGNSSNNSLDGGLGNDILDTGNGGIDTVNGGAGNDTYIFRSGLAGVTFVADSAGTDTIKNYGNFDFDISLMGIENVYLLGTANTSVIGGNAAANFLSGNSGDNTLEGGAGNDTLIGGAATTFNTLRGGDGTDKYVVVDADDVIEETNALAAGGIDVVEFNGTAGTLNLGANIENVILGGTANIGVTVTAGTTNNNMTGNSGDNTLAGFGGNDTINGAAGNDSIDGGADNDSLTGGDGNDTITGGAGNDTLIGGIGTNNLDGGDGNDTYTVTTTGGTIAETSTTGTDIVNYTGTVTTALTIGANIETINLLGTENTSVTVSAGTSNNVITGNSGNNSMSGGAGNDTINGGTGGDDTLTGGAGNDSLVGGAGADSMIGGANNDFYSVDNVGDIVSEVGGTGVDTVSSTVSYSLNTTAAAGVEILSLGAGVAALNATGNALGNTLNGNTLNNAIDGLDGNDTINAGTGNDTVTGGLGKDTVIVGTGNDSIVLANGDSLGAAASTAGIDLYSDLALNAGSADKIDLSVAIANIATAITVADVNEATFVADMNTVLSATGQGFAQVAGGIDAALVTVNSGDLTGQTFLAVDLDASGTYTATDLVIDITGSTVTSLTSLTFV